MITFLLEEKNYQKINKKLQKNAKKIKILAFFIYFQVIFDKYLFFTKTIL